MMAVVPHTVFNESKEIDYFQICLYTCSFPPQLDTRGFLARLKWELEGRAQRQPLRPEVPSSIGIHDCFWEFHKPPF